MDGICGDCENDLRWVVDNDGSCNLVCDTCKYIIHNLPRGLMEMETMKFKEKENKND